MAGQIQLIVLLFNPKSMIDCYTSGATAAYGILKCVHYINYGPYPLGNGHLYKGVSCPALASTPFILSIIIAYFLVFFSLLSW